MKSVLEGDVELSDALPYIDRCLGCLGCVTACPSGVPYGDLIMPFRSFAEQHRKRPFVDRVARKLTKETIPFPGRFRMAATIGNLAKPIRGNLPQKFEAMLDILPGRIPTSQPLPESYSAQGTKKARVAMLTGCVQQALAPEINWATLRVLGRNGVEVIIPKGQGCCGGLALHTGDSNFARQLAINNFQAFSGEYDAIITNAAGCGSSFHDYPLLFKDTEWEELAHKFAALSTDISEFLDKIGIEQPPALEKPVYIAYHDACHLAHAQGISTAPRNLLQQIQNAILIPLKEGDMCCGSAGSYNLEHPDIAQDLGRRKLMNILETGAEIVLTGNIGCLIQIQTHLEQEIKRSNTRIPEISLMHTIEFIDKAYSGSIPF
jgi:glycolate oxidase iron-sulfur subunit